VIYGFELRWITRWADSSLSRRIGAAKAGVNPSKVSVLQSRMLTDSVYVTPEGEQRGRFWTDWEDVPTCK
jgi:hypothetical protein